MNKLTNNDRRTIGINFASAGVANILLWAPNARSAAIHTDGENIPLEKQSYGYWQANTTRLNPGMSYQVLLDEHALPDIYSLHQPDVQGASLAFDVHQFQWTDSAWENIPLEQYVIYEIHTGTFSSEGNFEGITRKLEYLRSLGITAIELMPVAQFPGERNWGYDGVFPFAVQDSYGGPLGLQQLVDACHAQGLAVILDVVYNHVGPEGNYLEKFGPFFTEKYKTPWGNALNFDDAGCDGVRRYFMENALMWLRDFHIDALRLDAAHAIKDFSTKHILAEIKDHIVDFNNVSNTSHYLIIECDLNDPRFINPVAESGFGMDAQWTDEFHHALRVAAGEKKQGYYSDFEGLADLAEAFNHAYVYHGRFSPQRDKYFGADPQENPGNQFIVFSQNHDQVGNRLLGERSASLYSFEMQKLMAAAVMISPFLPMLFMGEEYGEKNPFLYFVSHSDPDLIKAVQQGRQKEFSAFHNEGEAPDPQSENTYKSSKLNWELLSQPGHQTMLDYYKALIGLRKNNLPLSVTDRNACRATADAGGAVLTVLRTQKGWTIACLLNFSKIMQTVSLPAYSDCRLIFNSADRHWGGEADPSSIQTGTNFNLQPESILILEQYV